MLNRYNYMYVTQLELAAVLQSTQVPVHLVTSCIALAT